MKLSPEKPFVDCKELNSYRGLCLCLWSMVGGLMVSGRWSVIELSVVSGRWSVVSGRWSVVG